MLGEEDMVSYDTQHLGIVLCLIEEKWLVIKHLNVGNVFKTNTR